MVFGVGLRYDLAGIRAGEAPCGIDISRQE